jgi:hypothetical protein
MHVGGFLKTGDERNFSWAATRLQHHGFVALSTMVTPLPAMRPIQNRDFFMLDFPWDIKKASGKDGEQVNGDQSRSEVA